MDMRRGAAARAVDMPRTSSVMARGFRPTAAERYSAQRARNTKLPFRASILIVDGRRQIALTDEWCASPLARKRRGVDDARVAPSCRVELAGRGQKFCIRSEQHRGSKLNGYAIQQCTLEAGDILSWRRGDHLRRGVRAAVHALKHAVDADTDSQEKNDSYLEPQKAY